MRIPRGLSTLALIVTGGLGFVLGSLISQQHSSIAAAPEAAGVAFAASAPTTAQVPEDGKLRIIFFGAHPDDSEYRGAGVAMKWAALGHHVKLVSVTNGDIGHWKMAGGPLAQRRTREVMEVGRR
jgi:hypothetical protein